MTTAERHILRSLLTRGLCTKRPGSDFHGGYRHSDPDLEPDVLDPLVERRALAESSTACCAAVECANDGLCREAGADRSRLAVLDTSGSHDRPPQDSQRVASAGNVSSPRPSHSKERPVEWWGFEVRRGVVK